MKNHFISHLPKNEIVNFIGTDQEKLFRKNLKRQDKDWIYRNKEIKYSFNEIGFRTRPFKDINWKESVVMFGCSNIQGVGLAEEDTLAMQLEKIIERPVINLGIGATGVDIACWNSLTLHENYPKPKAIIQVWSSLDRYADYRNNQLSAYVPSVKGYNYRLNWSFRSAKYIETDRALWRDKVVYIEGTYFKINKKYSDKLKIKQFDAVDQARDLIHPGINSNKANAECIADQLKSLI